MAKRKGMGGHQSACAATDTWLTPREILDALGTFDLDPCAAPNPEIWPTAQTHYVAPRDNGLLKPWFGRVWCNPPYGNALGVWLKRQANHGHGTSLIFARTETKAFFSGVWERADALLFLKGRYHFHFPDGRRSEINCGAPLVLAAYGASDAEILLDCGLEGAQVALNRPVMLYLALQHKPPMPAWRQMVYEAINGLGGSAKLTDLYSALEHHPKASNNPNWKAKIRQTVARIGLTQVAPATYQNELFAAI